MNNNLFGDDNNSDNNISHKDITTENNPPLLVPRRVETCNFILEE